MDQLEFLKYFRSDNSNIEFSAIWSNGSVVVSEENALLSKHNNIYFLAWVRKDLIYGPKNRAKDIDIIEKNYVVIDIDARNNLKALNWSDCTDDDIIALWGMLERNLGDLNEFLWDYSFIVYSWNWIHVYYIGEFIAISPDDYYYALQRIMKKWDSIWGDDLYKCDKACKNIARIIRLPWSYNQKNKKQVMIISQKESSWKLVWSLLILAQAEKEEQRIKEEEKVKNHIEEYEKQRKMDRVIYWDKADIDSEKISNVFEIINNIPAYLVAQKLVPEFWLSKNGKNFNNKKDGFTGYYYIEELNSICNWWSRYFNWWDESSSWWSSNLVKHWFDCSWWDVILWFKNNFNIKI